MANLSRLQKIRGLGIAVSFSLTAIGLCALHGILFSLDDGYDGGQSHLPPDEFRSSPGRSGNRSDEGQSIGEQNVSLRKSYLDAFRAIQEDIGANKSAEIAADDGPADENFTVDRSFLQYLKTLEPFPRKLHLFFPDKEYYRARDPPLPFVKHSVLSFMEANPAWNVTVRDDAEMDHIIERACRDGIISMEERNTLLGNDTTPAAHPVERCDLARMLLMWYEGGLYCDVDSLMNRNMTQVFRASTRMCLPIFADVNFAQSILCTSPKNRLFLQIIKAMSRKRLTGGPDGAPLERRGGWATGGSLFSMGPPIYNRFVLRKVFGIHYEGGKVPGIERAMEAILKQANDTIATGQYRNNCDTFLVEPFGGCGDHLNRSQLYQMYNMSRWGVAVRERWNTTT